jgi:hypothetical protein
MSIADTNTMLTFLNANVDEIVLATVLISQEVTSPKTEI